MSFELASCNEKIVGSILCFPLNNLIQIILLTDKSQIEDVVLETIDCDDLSKNLKQCGYFIVNYYDEDKKSLEKRVKTKERNFKD